MNKLACAKGAAMVELAILLPLLLILVFGIAEMGRAVYQQSILTRAADSAVRMLSRSHLTIDKETCAPLDTWDAAQADATNLLVYGDVDGGENALLEGLAMTSINIETRSLEGFEKDICIIVINAEAPFEPIFSSGVVFGFPAFNLTVTAEQRYIGE